MDGGSSELPAQNSTPKYEGKCGGSEEGYVCVMLELHLASQIRRGRWCAGNFFSPMSLWWMVILWKDRVCEGTGYQLVYFVYTPTPRVEDNGKDNKVLEENI